MKKLYKHFAVVIVMLIAVTGLSAHPGNPQPPTISSPAYTLYPPTNLQIIVIEVCDTYLSWNKPQDAGGNTPAGLLGYRIYRGGVLIHYTSDSDSLAFYDFIDDIGLFTYNVTAYYDLTSYGNPGLFGESTAVTGSQYVACGDILPLYEPWDLASFDYLRWTFLPSQGNWVMNTGQGNPIPAATFAGDPQLTNYNHLMRSMLLESEAWTCAKIYAEFDIRSVIVNPTSQEKLITEVYYDSTWHPIDSIVNDVSTEWIHHNVELTGASGKNIRVGIKAKGVNSSDIVEWDIDNIHVYPVCLAPQGISIGSIGNTVKLAWGKACTESSLLGYTIYRTDSSGLPPYYKLNTAYVVDTQYTDIFGAGTQGYYCYIVKASYKDLAGHLLCESGGDTACISVISGISDQNSQGTRIFPNPVSEVLNIQSDQQFTGIEILNFVGEKVYSEIIPASKNRNIFMKDYPAGIYMVKVRFGDRMVVRKVVKN
jgi:hypothetical protein